MDQDVAHALRAARFFRRLGLSPLPSERYKKRPMVEFRQHLRGQPLDERLFSDYHWSTTNLQLLTGTTSPSELKIVVVDCDGAEAVKTWARICQHYQQPETKTWKVRSGSGTGSHIYFRLPKGFVGECKSRLLWGVWDSFGQDGKGKWVKHSEIRLLADNNLVVAPPSVHVTAEHKYFFLAGCDPKTYDVPAEAPDWLLNMASARPPKQPYSFGSTPSAISSPGRSGHARNDRELVLQSIGDKLSLAREWGLKPESYSEGEGWISCRAPGREDRRPSGSFHVGSGYWKDWATLDCGSLFDLGVALGVFGSWIDCLGYCRERFCATSAQQSTT